MTTTLRCHRCDRRWRGSGDWNATLRAGVVVGATCPTCQTVEENTEATINEATLMYGRDEVGRIVGMPTA